MTGVLTAAAGFLFASHWHVMSWRLVAALVGSTFVIGSACVLNNLMDTGLDKRMQRTKKRALVTGEVSKNSAVALAVVLGIAGFVSLAYTNWLTFLVGVVGFLGYVAMYGYAKRTSVWSTLIGTIPGGAPMVAGYTAVIGRFDLAALLLFVVMTAWQMAHFYAIAVYRYEDYKAARLPIWSVRYGIQNTKYQIVGWAMLFVLACAALTLFAPAGWTFLVVMCSLGLRWFWSGTYGFDAAVDDVVWAKSVFMESLMVIMALSVMVAVGSVLP